MNNQFMFLKLSTWINQTMCKNSALIKDKHFNITLNTSSEHICSRPIGDPCQKKSIVFYGWHSTWVNASSRIRPKWTEATGTLFGVCCHRRRRRRRYGRSVGWPMRKTSTSSGCRVTNIFANNIYNAHSTRNHLGLAICEYWMSTSF